MAQDFDAGGRAVEIDVAAQARTVDQLLGGGADGFQPAQAGGQRSGEVGGRRLRPFGRLGQQEP